MSSLLERSILMTIGAAALTKEVAESVAGDFVERGEETTAEGRKAIDEAMDRAKDQARSLRDKLDLNFQQTFQDLGLVTRGEYEDLQLKMAQLEHRLALLEAGTASPSAAAGEPEEEEPVTEG